MCWVILLSFLLRGKWRHGESGWPVVCLLSCWRRRLQDFSPNHKAACQRKSCCLFGGLGKVSREFSSCDKGNIFCLSNESRGLLSPPTVVPKGSQQLVQVCSVQTPWRSCNKKGHLFQTMHLHKGQRAFILVLSTQFRRRVKRGLSICSAFWN